MFGSALRTVAGSALAAVVCASLFLPVAAQAEEGGSQPPPSSLATFDELYARLTAAAEEGGPPPDTAAPAEELRFALRRQLIRGDAEIEILKLEVARFTGERQQEALARLVDAATARERSVWLAIRQLERLAGELLAAAPVPEPAAAEKAGKGGFKITFEAQDVTEDPDP